MARFHRDFASLSILDGSPLAGGFGFPARTALRYASVTFDPKVDLPEPPRLPERAAIYIAPDGTVKFGALFEGLVPVAEAISAKPLPIARAVPAGSRGNAGR
jgi:hypothetical protein